MKKIKSHDSASLEQKFQSARIEPVLGFFFSSSSVFCFGLCPPPPPFFLLLSSAHPPPPHLPGRRGEEIGCGEQCRARSRTPLADVFCYLLLRPSPPNHANRSPTGVTAQSVTHANDVRVGCSLSLSLCVCDQ